MQIVKLIVPILFINLLLGCKELVVLESCNTYISSKYSKYFGSQFLEAGRGLCQLRDGSIVIVGSTLNTFRNSRNAFFRRINRDNGTIISEVQFNPFSTLDRLWSAIETKDGKIAVVGQTQSGTPNNDNVLVMILDTAGKIEKTFPPYNEGGIELGYNIVETDEGYLAITGLYLGYKSSQSVDVLLLVYDRDGNIKNKVVNFGTKNKTEFAKNIIKTRKNELVMIGYTNGYPTSSSDTVDVFIVKTNSIGEQIYSNTLTNAIKLQGNDYGFSIREDNNGDFVFFGITIKNNVQELFIIRTDENFKEIKFQKNIPFNAVTSFYNNLTTNSYGDIIILPDGTYAFQATGDVPLYKRDIYLYRMTKEGNFLLNKKTINLSDFQEAIDFKLTNDCSFIFTGYSTSFGGQDRSFIIKTDMNGNF